MEASDIPAGALEELAIFPLPNVVLFPNALLPLHVFEPRYRALMADILSGSRLLAVPRLRPGYEADYQGCPEVFDIMGIGVCLQADRLPDGRYNVLVRGLARVFLEEELELAPERPYRRVRARLLPDARSTRPDGLAVAHKQLVALCDRLAEVVPEGEPALRQLARAVDTPGGCADIIASALVRDPDARQTMLELTDPADRLDQAIAHVEALVARMGPGRGSTLN